MNKLYFFQNIFLMITLVLSFLAFYSKPAMDKMILSVRQLRKGEVHRLIFSGFIHADYVHLLFNMLTYYAFAYTWSSVYNVYFGLAWWIFGVFYVSAILVVNLFVWWMNYKKADYYSLGASGGVSALLFSCILLFPWEKLYVFFIPMPSVVFAFLYLGYSTYRSFKQTQHDHINHFAHLVGSLYGVIFSGMVEPHVFTIFLTELVR